MHDYVTGFLTAVKGKKDNVGTTHHIIHIISNVCMYTYRYVTSVRTYVVCLR